MKRLSPIPRRHHHADIDKLRRRQAELAGKRKNTAGVARELALAVAAQIRREIREEAKS